MRALNILDFALASLRRRPGKTSSILVVYMMLTTVLASILFLTQALKSEAAAMLDVGPPLVVQKMIAGRHELIPVSTAVSIRQIPGVKSVSPRVWGYYYDGLIGSNYTLMGVTAGETQLELLDGHLPTGDTECAIGAGIAEVRRVQRGDDLILIDHLNIGRIFMVSGVFQSSSNILTNDLLVMEESTLRHFFGMDERLATDLAVDVYNPSEIETVAVKIKRSFPESRPITRSELLRTYHAVFDWRSGMMLALFTSALLSFCILAWDKATGLSAGERNEIGILKAIGWDTSDVLLLKFWEGFVISVLAFLGGLLLAFCMVFFWDMPLLGDILRGWSILFPDLQLVPFVDPYQVISLAFLTIVPYVVSTVIPAWRAACMDPAEVMRD